MMTHTPDRNKSDHKVVRSRRQGFDHNDDTLDVPLVFGFLNSKDTSFCIVSSFHLALFSLQFHIYGLTDHPFFFIS